MRKNVWKSALCGALAGAANGLFGAGGGMVLLPLLRKLRLAEERALFATALAVMLPVSAVSFAVLWLRGAVDLTAALPYCVGGIGGGLLAGLCYRRLPLRALHIALGLLILWGGIRQFLH